MNTIRKAHALVLALLIARSLHYSIEGILAVRYGYAVLLFMTAHKIGFALAVLATLLLFYIAGRLLFQGSSAD